MTVKAMIRPLDFTGYSGEKFGDPYVPEHTQDTLRRYVEDGLYPGSFVTAVLCNDLFGAISRADSMNASALKDICLFVYNRMPADSWGSAEKMRAWVEKVNAMKEGE